MGTVRKLTGAQAAMEGADKATAMTAPYRDFSEQFGMRGLEDLFSGRMDLFKQPGVAKNFDAGAEAMQRRLSASGFRGSGNELLSLADYTGDFTRNLYNDFFNQRMGITQMGANAAVGTGSNVVSGYNQAGASMAKGFGDMMDLAGTGAGLMWGKPPGTK